MVLLQESLQGYPEHRWLAAGHIAEAEAEAMGAFPDIAEMLRQARKRMEQEPEWIPALMPVIEEISRRVGEAKSACILRTSSKQRNGGVKMNIREMVARELVAVVKILAGCEKLPEGPMRDNCEKKKEEGEKNKEAAWEPVRKDVNVGLRNKEVHDSLTSYAPRISASMRKKASMELGRQGYDVNPRELNREWSQYLAYIDPEMNNNKYHYYVVYSFKTPTGEQLFTGWNCSGRIGIIERAYDLTEKFLGGPANSLTRAIAAVEKHLNTKKYKGYSVVKMIRG